MKIAKINLLISVLSLFGLIAGCGTSVSNNNDTNSPKINFQTKNDNVPDTSVQNKNTDVSQTENNQKPTVLTKSKTVISNKNNTNVINLSEFSHYLDTWYSEAEQTRSTISGNIFSFRNLPSDNYGTSQFIVDFNNVQSEYNEVNKLSGLLDKQEAKMSSLFNNHKFNKDQKQFEDVMQEIHKFDVDIETLTYIMDKELQGEISLVNQFKSGSSNPHVPYWTFNEWDSISNDQYSCWKKIILDYDQIKQDA